MKTEELKRCPQCAGNILKENGRVLCKNFPINCDFSRKSEKTSVSFGDTVLVFFDVETTGFMNTDDIIQLAAEKHVNGEVVGKFNSLIKPLRGKQVSAKITELTTITNEALVSAPEAKDALESFKSWLYDENAPEFMLAHNAKFDVRMMQNAYKNINVPFTFAKTIDTMALAKAVIPKGSIENYKQETLAKYFGISYDSGDGGQAHQADADVATLALITAELVKMLPEGREVHEFAKD